MINIFEEEDRNEWKKINEDKKYRKRRKWDQKKKKDKEKVTVKTMEKTFLKKKKKLSIVENCMNPEWWLDWKADTEVGFYWMFHGGKINSFHL